MNIAGIIPARYASSRFPGKPLVMIKGKSMIQRVYEQTLKCKALKTVIVATDDKRIFEHVKGFGGIVVMTSSKHKSGTERCAEVALKLKNISAVINIQGDEPFLKPEQISAVAKMLKSKNCNIATLAKKISTESEITNSNVVKVVIAKNQEALYFSRSEVPYNRSKSNVTYFKHIGIYGFKSLVLKQITGLKPSNLEKAEMLEQLRWLENGYKIKVSLTNQETIAIDTPEDLSKIK
jgi:3-deoxy-manno-octulosonate cytidylyltransferase (CMP-KDO synthetase)